MSAKPNESQRRSDHVMAERVQCGLSLLYLAGVAEACQYMARVGVAGEIIERVLTARNVRGSKSHPH